MIAVWAPYGVTCCLANKEKHEYKKKGKKREDESVSRDLEINVEVL